MLQINLACLVDVEALESALSHYKGTLLMISHDRYFLDKLVGRVVELKDGRIEDYTGNYSYYLEKRKAFDKPVALPAEKASAPTAGRKSKEQKRKEAEARQAVSEKRNRLQERVGSLEKAIDSLEKRKKEIEERLILPETYKDTADSVSLQKEYASVKKELSGFYEDWEIARLELEELLSRLP